MDHHGLYVMQSFGVGGTPYVGITGSGNDNWVRRIKMPSLIALMIPAAFIYGDDRLCNDMLGVLVYSWWIYHDLRGICYINDLGFIGGRPALNSEGLRTLTLLFSAKDIPALNGSSSSQASQTFSITMNPAHRHPASFGCLGSFLRLRLSVLPGNFYDSRVLSASWTIQYLHSTYLPIDDKDIFFRSSSSFITHLSPPIIVFTIDYLLVPITGQSPVSPPRSFCNETYLF
ncbi:uncharacterized protein H6S33_010926 [Morchella sextelata]|uniref:uncharacterized protein n=1 Tax=Morchella sextelata TaxID=1174677 RepID=UPI001D04F5FB|nr:uncharacterized protein H6S33_010926 [Morchella sextelata]KAH0611661.1 hypothetical protein H6S33_010926 [Morchella sextelata]